MPLRQSYATPIDLRELLTCGFGAARGRSATCALTEFAFTAPGVHTVFANVELSNPPSVRVLEKAGFRRHGAEGDLARFHAVAADLR